MPELANSWLLLWLCVLIAVIVSFFFFFFEYSFAPHNKTTHRLQHSVSHYNNNKTQTSLDYGIALQHKQTKAVAAGGG